MDKHPREGLLDYIVVLVSIFLRNPNTIFYSSCIILHSHHQHTGGSNFSTSSPTLVIYFICLIMVFFFYQQATISTFFQVLFSDFPHLKKPSTTKQLGWAAVLPWDKRVLCPGPQVWEHLALVLQLLCPWRWGVSGPRVCVHSEPVPHLPIFIPCSRHPGPWHSLHICPKAGFSTCKGFLSRWFSWRQMMPLEWTTLDISGSQAGAVCYGVVEGVWTELGCAAWDCYTDELETLLVRRILMPAQN